MRDGIPLETFEFCIHPDDLEWVRRERPRCFGPSGHGVLEYRVIDPKGAVRWVMCRAIYEVDAEGTMVKARGMLIDITALKDDGNAAHVAPAPFVDPVRVLVDAALLSHAAARQIGNTALVQKARTFLFRAGRLLASDMVAKAT